MQEHELAMRLIKAEDFDAVRSSLDDVDIPIYSPDKVYKWQEERYSSLTFFNEDKDSVFKTLSVLGVSIYTHPAGKTLRYSYDEIYRLMFREDADEILRKIENPESIFFGVKTQIDKDIRLFISMIIHAKEILGEDFLNIGHDDKRKLKDVVNEMKRFLRRRSLK